MVAIFQQKGCNCVVKRDCNFMQQRVSNDSKMKHLNQSAMKHKINTIQQQLLRSKAEKNLALNNYNRSVKFSSSNGKFSEHWQQSSKNSTINSNLFQGFLMAKTSSKEWWGVRKNVKPLEKCLDPTMSTWVAKKHKVVIEMD